MPETTPQTLDIPSDWQALAAEIGEKRPARVLVLGPVDVGKSTLCRILLASLHPGLNAALLDTDLGQKAVGPPACVTLGRWMGDRLALDAFAFVGSTDPMRGRERAEEGVRRLSDDCRSDLLLINTDGFVQGPGIPLKRRLLALLNPDLIILLGGNAGTAAILKDWPEVLLRRLPPSPLARRKTDGEKRAARREAFRHWFRNAAALPSDSTGATPPLLPGQLLGLADADGRDTGLAVVRGDDAETGALHLLAAPSGASARINPGLLILDEDWRDRPLKRD